jgi:Tfp pilus assembly major pilin PilA
MGFFILTMNYGRIYEELCKRGQVRHKIEGEYYEVHHIIPRSMGGIDDPSNLTTLTGREHFIAHLILTRLYPENEKVIYAAWLMANKGAIGKMRKYKVSARTYEQLKKEWHTHIIKAKTGTKLSEGVKEKIRQTKLKNPLKTRGSTGMKWFHNPLTMENKLCNVNDVPVGYVIGRINIKTEKTGQYKWIHNPMTGEYKKLKSEEHTPNGWCIGVGRGKTKSIHNPTTMDRKYISKNEVVPDGWVLGVGSLSDTHKENIRKSKIVKECKRA